MPYSTVIEVRNALSPGDWADGNPPEDDDGDTTTDDVITGTAADLTNAQLLDAIAEADSLIDSYIGGKYVVPVINQADGTPYPATPHPLDFWSRNIAAYNATLTNSRRQDFADTDPVARRYNATMIALTAVRDGKSVLSIPENSAGDNSTVGAGPVFNNYGPGALFPTCDFDINPPLFPVPSGWAW